MLNVADVRKSVAFYTAVFGFKLPCAAMDEWAQLDTGTTMLAFHKGTGKTQILNEDTTGSVNPSWFVRDIAATEKLVLANGGKVVKKAEKQMWGGTKATYADIDGILNSVVEVKEGMD